MEIRLLVTGSDASWIETVCAQVDRWEGQPRVACTREGPFDVVLLQADELQPALARLAAMRSSVAAPFRVLLARPSCGAEEAAFLVRHAVNGCVDCTDDTESLARAVRGVASGEDWFSRRTLLLALQRQFDVRRIEVRKVDPLDDSSHLTHREGEILQLIGQGLTNKEIARRLEISDQTVKTHLHRVYAKLHQSGRFKAYLAQPGDAVRNGSPSSPHAAPRA